MKAVKIPSIGIPVVTLPMLGLETIGAAFSSWMLDRDDENCIRLVDGSPLLLASGEPILLADGVMKVKRTKTK